MCSLRRICTGAPLKARTTSGNGSEGSQASAGDLLNYPDTGETGETYDLEVKEIEPNTTSKEAVEKAAEFLRKQGTQSPFMGKLNR